MKLNIYICMYCNTSTLQAFKRQQADFPLTSDKAKLMVTLKDMKNQKLQYQKQCEHLQLKLNEALGDVKVILFVYICG